MTTYKRSDRRHWRFTLRRVAWRVNLLLATLALLAVVWLAQAGAVSAAPRCPGGRPQPVAAATRSTATRPASGRWS